MNILLNLEFTEKILRKLLKLFHFLLISKNIRDTLKQQMDQKGRLIKHEFENNQLEVKYVIEQDKDILSEEKRKRIEKLRFLTTYRNENKQVSFLSLFILKV